MQTEEKRKREDKERGREVKGESESGAYRQGLTEMGPEDRVQGDEKIEKLGEPRTDTETTTWVGMGRFKHGSEGIVPEGKEDTGEQKIETSEPGQYRDKERLGRTDTKYGEFGPEKTGYYGELPGTSEGKEGITSRAGEYLRTGPLRDEDTRRFRETGIVGEQLRTREEIQRMELSEKAEIEAQKRMEERPVKQGEQARQGSETSRTTAPRQEQLGEVLMAIQTVAGYEKMYGSKHPMGHGQPFPPKQEVESARPEAASRQEVPARHETTARSVEAEMDRKKDLGPPTTAPDYNERYGSHSATGSLVGAGERIQIRKRDGSVEAFDPGKIERSALATGANPEEAREIAGRVERSARAEMTTAEIEEQVRTYLRVRNPAYDESWEQHVRSKRKTER
jgi:hypothetical protein